MKILKMEDFANRTYNAMRKIFSYLTGRELYNASLVCRYWANIAHDENFGRGPINMNLFVMGENSVLRKVTEAVKRLPIYPCLNMLFYTGSIYVNKQTDCPCKELHPDCYSISLQVAAMPDYYCIFGIFLPASHTIQINTCTFIRHSVSSGIMYSPELRHFFCSNHEFPLSLRTYVKRFLINDSIQTNCMILICDKRDFTLLANFVLMLRDWFPNSKISIWGGTSSQITICKTINSKHYCRVPVNLTCYFISSKNLQTWTITWSAEGQTREMVKEKLINLKQRIKLKQHSLSLIFKSCSCPPSSSILELNIFVEIFPEIPYFYMNSDAVIGGEGLEDVTNVIDKSKFLRSHGTVIGGNEEIAIMILTWY